MNTTGYSEQAAAQIQTVLKELEYNYTFQDELGIFRIHFRLQPIRDIIQFIAVESDCYSVSAICPLRVPQERITAVGEFIGRINRKLRFGSFILDYDTGELRSHCEVMFRGFLPWTDVVEKSIQLPVELFRRFGDGLLAVMYSEVFPKEIADQMFRSE